MDAETTTRKQRGRAWPKGTSGNPAGRPKGSRHHALVALDAIGSDGAEAVLRSVRNAAEGGDIDLRKVLRGLVRNPRTLRALVSTGIDFNRALRSLRGCRGFISGGEGIVAANA